MTELKQWSELEKHKTVTKTSGYWVHYNNEKHIDIQSGNSAYVLGYSDDEVLNAMRENSITFLRGNSGESAESNEELIRTICSKGNWASLAWAVSGSDAVEAMIAMNDYYWQYKGQNKNKIICFDPGFHGTTMIAKHLRGEYSYFNRALIVQAPSWKTYDNRQQEEQRALDQVKMYLRTNSDVGCIMMESIPWIGDITPYSENWWKSVRFLCDKYDVLMLVDDVAVCWGKNGTMFGWQPYDVQPDISALGKALTAGYSPLGAAVCNEKVKDVLSTRSWEHGHTWAPNMQGVAASLVATKKIEVLLSRVPYIKQQLEYIAQDLDLNYRGSGLFMCMDTPKNITLGQLSSAGLAATIPGINCVKVAAPLIADDEYFYELKTRLKPLI